MNLEQRVEQLEKKGKRLQFTVLVLQYIWFPHRCATQHHDVSTHPTISTA
jgi:uncharacterized metal-binding protein